MIDFFRFHKNFTSDFDTCIKIPRRLNILLELKYGFKIIDNEKINKIIIFNIFLSEIISNYKVFNIYIKVRHLYNKKSDSIRNTI